MKPLDKKDILMKEIIGDALGDLADWKKPSSQKSIGPNFPELADAYLADIQAIKQTLSEMLKPWPAEELIKRFQEKNYNGRRQLRDPEGTSFEIVIKIQRLKEREPAWFIFGWLDLSRFRAAPSARLSHFPFESDGAFPTQC